MYTYNCTYVKSVYLQIHSYMPTCICRALIQQSSAYGVNVSLADVRIFPEVGSRWSSAYLIYSNYYLLSCNFHMFIKAS